MPSKVFLMVTRLYFSSKEAGERSVCLSFAFLFLLLAMLVQVVREETLELGLEPGRCALLRPKSLSVCFCPLPSPGLRLGLTLWLWLVSNSQSSSCLCPSSTGIRIYLLLLFLKIYFYSLCTDGCFPSCVSVYQDCAVPIRARRGHWSYSGF